MGWSWLKILNVIEAWVKRIWVRLNFTKNCVFVYEKPELSILSAQLKFPPSLISAFEICVHLRPITGKQLMVAANLHKYGYYNTLCHNCMYYTDRLTYYMCLRRITLSLQKMFSFKIKNDLLFFFFYLLFEREKTI